LGSSEVSCVLTRFKVKRVWDLLAMYRAYRQIRRAARHVDGLIATKFFVEDAHTCYTFSLWRDDSAILQFNTNVPAHPKFANSMMRHLYEPSQNRFGLWSAQFKLFAVSRNLSWDEVDLGVGLEEATETVPA
jgi:hypothetical protein